MDNTLFCPILKKECIGKNYILIPAHDYRKMKNLLTSIADDYKRRAKIIEQHCPPEYRHSKGPTRSEERYLEIYKILSELDLHSKVVEDY